MIKFIDNLLIWFLLICIILMIVGLIIIIGNGYFEIIEHFFN